MTTVGDAPIFTARELQREAEREVAMRRHVYGKSDGSTGRTRTMADRRIAMMEAIASYFKQIADADETQGRLKL